MDIQKAGRGLSRCAVRCSLGGRGMEMEMEVEVRRGGEDKKKRARRSCS